MTMHRDSSVSGSEPMPASATGANTGNRLTVQVRALADASHDVRAAPVAGVQQTAHVLVVAGIGTECCVNLVV